jgi:NAD(P)-dependent dehydrogenase (short-subunit alcohol dehydrogenase family)
MTANEAMKVAIVTGAGSGIGRAVSLGLLRAGYAVVLAGRREAALAETGSLAPAKSRWLAVPTDIRVELSVTALFSAALKHFERLDLLFNNAGISASALPFEELSLAQWNEVVAVNLTGAFLCAREAFRIMKQQQPQGGRIINNGSISAHVPRPHSAPYTATKHALTGLTRSLSLDGRAHRIACGQIDIGNAQTSMTSRMIQGALQPDGSMSAEPTIDVSLVADAVVSMANLPLEANVPFMTLMATQMPFAGRG